ncbi:Methylthioribose-1-phosphate isomerase [hydrothermal vent metagenome]|uniref:Methylthioribose-1-phosphate isomerase n=1 Tax=hydrothermal vent metagenome TaxID=652676 RepID=A0A3B0ZAP8_9ZZZZ
MSDFSSVNAVEWRDDTLKMLDQRILPEEVAYIEYRDAPAVAEGIRQMVVRGAPAIGIAAAYGVVLAARRAYAKNTESWRIEIEEDLECLAQSRPTAVNLFWALKTMKAHFSSVEGNPEPSLLALAQKIHNDDIAANQKMGVLGANLIEPDAGVLTHCNAGALATGGYGTALGVIRSAFSDGKIKHVYADETRPWMQGARLTAWEMVQDNIPVTLLAEGAAAYLMKLKRIKWIIVGADRVAANGDVANKIGTYSLAVLARHHGVKFMVVAPSSTLDMNAESGEQIPIEERSGEELHFSYGRRISAEGAQAWNPVFDVTPASLVDALVTERGLVEQPSTKKLSLLMG